MHILVTNDDGPPSLQSSPYIHPFISALESVGHLVSVVLPHQQRSWIGKAHFVSQVVQPQYYKPSDDAYSGGEGSSVHPNPTKPKEVDTDGSDHIEKIASDAKADWVLIEGTPATCTQLGLFHLFKNRPPVDLVVSGPNYGRNVTALFSLSSGTIGGAMEAATLQWKAIALSFAFWSRVHDKELIGEACRHSVKLIGHLAKAWGEDVDLYSVNVPLMKGVERHKVVVCPVLQNFWKSGSCLEEIEAAKREEEAETRETEIREGKGRVESNAKLQGSSFRWKPKFADVGASIDESNEGNDGWAINRGFTSVTPLRANFMHASSIPFGEMKLSNAKNIVSIRAIIEQDEYILPLIYEALSECLPAGTLVRTGGIAQLTDWRTPLLQILPYEKIDFEHVLKNPTTSLANSYVIRKALIRKHHLWHTISSWWVKHPDDVALRGHVPLSVNFELDYAEFLEEALVECWELNESFDKGERELWILKPSMSEQGQGVRIFSTEKELKTIFEEWEGEEFDEDDEDDEVAQTTIAVDGTDRMGASTMTSQLRHFVAQRYIAKPLVFKEHHYRKFHVRSYVLAVGALKVYIYLEMLALFAPLPYRCSRESMAQCEVHLTNTCLQSGKSKEGNVHRFWDLPESNAVLAEGWKGNALNQMKLATSVLFEAASREQMVHFQTLPNVFEAFGIDWLIDDSGNVWLLEVNAFPDFRQSGDALKQLVAGFWQGIIRTAVVPFFGIDQGPQRNEQNDMIKVLDIDLGRG